MTGYDDPEVYAKGLTAAAELGELGHIEPDLALSMIDSVAADPAVMARHFPGRTRDDLVDAYDEAVRDLVAADSFRVERQARERAARQADEYLASATGMAPSRVRALLGGDVRTLVDLNDMERINSL